MAKNKSTNKENKGSNAASKIGGQSHGKAPGKEMNLKEKKLQLLKALEDLEKQEEEIKRQQEIEKMQRLMALELDSFVPTLIPTVTGGYNLNKRVLASVYLKELSHHIFLVWSDSLYGNKPIDIKTIRTAIDPLILDDKKFQLTPENVFIMAIQTKSRIQPLGSCFVLLPKDKTGNEETEITHRIVKHRSHIIIVDKLTLVKHMKAKHLLIFSNGYEEFVKTIPAQSIRDLKPVGSQGDPKNQSKAQLPPEVSQQATIPKTRSPTSAQPVMIKQIQWPTKESETEDNNSNEQAVTSDSSSQSESEDSDGDDCQIIDAPIVNQPPPETDAHFGPVVRDFIPVTEDTVSKAIALISQFENQGRAVAIVFDSYFFLETVNMEVISKKYKDIFGKMDNNQVLIRINSPKLAVNLDEAQNLGIKALNQAYIIAQQGLTDTDINRRAAARNVFCCPMTLGCVVNNLKRGVFMMHKSAFDSQVQVESVAPQPKRSNTGESDNLIELNNISNTSIKSKGSSSSTGKRDRIAASLGTTIEVSKGMLPTVKDQAKPPIIGAASSSLAKNATIDVDKEFLKNLKQQGDTVIEIDNLPAKLSVLALNLMMGTYTLKPEQVIASLRKVKGNNDLMDVRIVINKDNQDVGRILVKNGCKTCHNMKLLIKLGNHEDLQKFIQTRSKTLRRMDANMNLPTNKIGYSKESR